MTILAYLYQDPLLSVAAEPQWQQVVDRVYRDVGDRTQRQQLLQDCQAESPDYVLIQHLADLGDSVADVVACLAQFEALGTAVITVDAGATTPATLELLKSLQTEQHRRHIQRGHARNRLRALPPPGAAPYGYRRGKDRYVIDRSTAPIVKDFFEQFLLYGSLRRAVRHLARKYGKTISVSTGRRWLTSPVYRGDLAYTTGHVILNTHTPILAREEAAQIDRLLRRNQSLPRRSASAPRSLSGLVVCDACGSGMTISQVSRRGVGRRSTDNHESAHYLYLRPIACRQHPKCKSIPYNQVLHQTIQRICHDLPAAIAGTPLPNLDRVKQGIQQAIMQKQQIIAQLPDLTHTGVLDSETAALRTYKLQAEIAQLQGQLAQLPPVDLAALMPTVSLPQFWLDLSESERRFYFREFIRQIRLVRNVGNTWELQLVFIF
ncbi:MAG: recombinase family protein [Cyanobacteria bacterium]|nr:recombinase family protein [Cyanobacteriota bacterium]MDW8202350.1 recombinase family protein [Cyanobacteriota bacterium SKYGB_h_bin112]